MKLSNEQQSYNLDFLSPDIRTSPVIKIDFKGRILYANSASFELLHEWLFPANEYLRGELITAQEKLAQIETKLESYDGSSIPNALTRREKRKNKRRFHLPIRRRK